MSLEPRIYPYFGYLLGYAGLLGMTLLLFALLLALVMGRSFYPVTFSTTGFFLGSSMFDTVVSNSFPFNNSAQVSVKSVSRPSPVLAET